MGNVRFFTQCGFARFGSGGRCVMMVVGDGRKIDIEIMIRAGDG